MGYRGIPYRPIRSTCQVAEVKIRAARLWTSLGLMSWTRESLGKGGRCWVVVFSDLWVEEQMRAFEGRVLTAGTANDRR